MPISPLADKVILTRYHHDGPGSNGPITRLVIHATVSPTKPGGAEANAHYFQSAAAGGAAHYVVDVSESVCCVDEDQKAAHAPPNAGSIGLELCDPQSGDPSRWQDADHQAMLLKAAPLCADICARHSLPIVWLDVPALLRGDKGITSHANVAAAWRQSDHTDPGPDFPVGQFLALISPATEDDDVTYLYVKKPNSGDVFVARHGEPPVHVGSKNFGFEAAEAMARYQGDKLIPSTDGTDITDANGKTRKVLVLDSTESQQWFGI